MGQALSSETHSIPGGDGYRYWVGLNMKAFRGCKKTVYKGILLGSGPRWGENVVVKSFTNVRNTKKNWTFEVVKADVTRQMIPMYQEMCRDNCIITVVSPSIVQMDKVSKVNKWLNDRKGSSTICADDWVSVEEFIPGEFLRFSPWNETHEFVKRKRREADDLATFAHFTFMKSQGNFVICDFQGVMKAEEDRNSFIVTDSIIHSLRKEYGSFDEGEFGITEFFKRHKCTSVCRQWLVPNPLTPPPPFSTLPLTPPPAFENIVLPTRRVASNLHPEANGEGDRRVLSASTATRRRHLTGEESPRAGSMRVSQTSTNMQTLNLPIDDVFEGRVRSNSTSSQLRRHRFQSDRTHNSSQYMQPLSLIIPDAPPPYEECMMEGPS